MWFQCLITVLRQFFKSICTTKQPDGKYICCALITDYYNPMNRHLSCQHLQCKLLPPDCDPIYCIFHHIPSFLSKKSSYVDFSSNVGKSAHRAHRRPQGLQEHSSTFTILTKDGSARIPFAFFFFLHTFVLSSSTSHKYWKCPIWTLQTAMQCLPWAKLSVINPLIIIKQS